MPQPQQVPQAPQVRDCQVHPNVDFGVPPGPDFDPPAAGDEEEEKKEVRPNFDAVVAAPDFDPPAAGDEEEKKEVHPNFDAAGVDAAAVDAAVEEVRPIHEVVVPHAGLVEVAELVLHRH